MISRRIRTHVRALAFALCAPGLLACERRVVEPPAEVPQAFEVAAPSGAYALDPHHASLTVRVLHQGFSYYTFRLDRLEANMNFDAATLQNSTVTATVDLGSVNTGLESFDAEVSEFFGVDQFAEARFVSTSVAPTGPNTARIVGDLALNGRIRPVEFAATLNRAAMDMFGRPRLGLSLRGAVPRSDFGIAPELSEHDVAENATVIVELELVRRSDG